MADIDRNVYRKRKRMLNVFLTDEELDMLGDKARAVGVSKSEYIRNLIRYGATTRNTNLTTEQARDIVSEMNHIGNNINQIATVANTSKTVDYETVESLINALYEVEEAVLKYARGGNGDY